MMRLLRSADYRRMPWKNGGGETREIIASPVGATLDTLDWRVSLATVASDGPFSVFRGISRTLCVIRGAGIRIQVGDGAPELLLPSSEPYTFDGEAATSATLVDGPIVDLNVMTRIGRCEHTVKRLAIENRRPLEVRASAAIVFCESGPVRCSDGQSSIDLQADDSVLIDTDVALIDFEASASAGIIVIEVFS